jgi:hemerythrin
MFKIDVTPGVAWVEIPEADLRILCGCPADTVKHLIRRGLVRPTVVKGIACETGPNAILLSDVMVQGGDFANLAEFPVLQMFYRQGMLLPGHPNNTGAKPMLIGGRERVEAQMQYIFRGNYGLISEEELLAAGVPADQARQMMRLKLRFAFGRISHPRDLLDGVALGDGSVVIRPGVGLRRLRPNVFEFRVGDETLEVDLNLGTFQTYECPYSLGATQFTREYFAVVHLGEGDGWDIRRATMGSIVVYQGKINLVDAGPNLSASLRALGVGVNEVEGVFVTHSHDDHIAGLTTLMRADRRIKFFAVPMVRAAVTKKLAALLDIEERDFASYFDVVDLRLGEWNNIDGMEVKPVFSPHPVETTIFQFRALAEGGYRSYAHFADVVGLKTLAGMITDDPLKPGLDRSLYDQVVADYAEPANIKKIDIGGGLIHGDATDFASDQSSRIILAHTSLALTREQKRIGSGSSFGSVEVLIPSHRDFLSRAAFHFLADHLAGVPSPELGALLNGPVVTFNPESILLRGGHQHDHIYLLLTGLVELLDEESDFRAELSAGAFLGEMSGLQGMPAFETIRALSFVQALALPTDLYRAFIMRHDLFAGISHLFETREFLSRTWLLGDVVSTGTLNAIAKSAKTIRVAAGVQIDQAEPAVYLIETGRVSRVLGEQLLESLGPGDFFGEERAVFDVPVIASFKCDTDVVLYQLPTSQLGEIPNVRWKLFETFGRRTSVEPSACQLDGRNLLKWHDEYSVHIQWIDMQHRRLFASANRVLDAVERQTDASEVADALSKLVDYTRYHFQAEEELLHGYQYPAEDGHSRAHAGLVTQVEDLQSRIAGGTSIPADEILTFLHGWIVKHILIEDRRYGEFLNERGVF